MIKISILGYGGRMGNLIAEEISHFKNARIVSCLVHTTIKSKGNKFTSIISNDPDEVIRASDVTIDFTNADATLKLARCAAKWRKAFVSGTTGITEAQYAELKKIARTIPILYAPNTSLSLAAMKQVTELAAVLLGKFDYDIAILDEHHSAKKDAPSGTAKVLGEAVIKGTKGKRNPHYVSLRAGQIVGEHEVIFAGPGETIRLHHSVTDRRIFARGAVLAARWLANKPKGFYTMDDVLGL